MKDQKHQCVRQPTRFQLRCCDAAVVALGLMVTLGSLFHREITFLLLGE